MLWAMYLSTAVNQYLKINYIKEAEKFLLSATFYMLYYEWKLGAQSSALNVSDGIDENLEKQ